MSDTSPPPAAEPLLFEGQYSANADFADRLSAVSFRRSTFRPQRIARIVVLAVLVSGTAYVFDFRAGVVASTGLAGIGFASFAIVVFLAYLSSFIRGRNHLRKQFPAGTVFYLGLRESTMTVRNDVASTDIAYRAYRACEPDGTFVFLRRRDTPISTILPAECFTSESLAWLSRQIENA